VFGVSGRLAASSAYLRGVRDWPRPKSSALGVSLSNLSSEAASPIQHKCVSKPILSDDEIYVPSVVNGACMICEQGNYVYDASRQKIFSSRMRELIEGRCPIRPVILDV